jgi:hypothetical protein
VVEEPGPQIVEGHRKAISVRNRVTLDSFVPNLEA